MSFDRGASVKYLEKINETLRPYDGRLLIHGGQFENLEGNWTDLVVIQHPDLQGTRAWQSLGGKKREKIKRWAKY